MSPVNYSVLYPMRCTAQYYIYAFAFTSAFSFANSQALPPASFIQTSDSSQLLVCFSPSSSPSALKKHLNPLSPFFPTNVKLNHIFLRRPSFICVLTSDVCTLHCLGFPSALVKSCTLKGAFLHLP